MRPSTRGTVAVGLTVMLGSLALAAGCKSEPPPPKPPAPTATTHIQAVQPTDMTEQVTLTPTFKWKLPSALGNPSLVSFTLAEVGPMAQPPKDRAGDKQIAFASGLHDTSPTELNPFHPPTGCVLTGALRESKQLQGDTWYRWSIRAMGERATASADFFFRTRKEEPGAAPAPAPKP